MVLFLGQRRYADGMAAAGRKLVLPGQLRRSPDRLEAAFCRAPSMRGLNVQESDWKSRYEEIRKKLKKLDEDYAENTKQVMNAGIFSERLRLLPEPAEILITTVI